MFIFFVRFSFIRLFKYVWFKFTEHDTDVFCLNVCSLLFYIEYPYNCGCRKQTAPVYLGSRSGKASWISFVYLFLFHLLAQLIMHAWNVWCAHIQLQPLWRFLFLICYYTWRIQSHKRFLFPLFFLDRREAYFFLIHDQINFCFLPTPQPRNHENPSFLHSLVFPPQDPAQVLYSVMHMHWYYLHFRMCTIWHIPYFRHHICPNQVHLTYPVSLSPIGSPAFTLNLCTCLVVELSLPFFFPCMSQANIFFIHPISTWQLSHWCISIRC